MRGRMSVKLGFPAQMESNRSVQMGGLTRPVIFNQVGNIGNPGMLVSQQASNLPPPSCSGAACN